MRSAVASAENGQRTMPKIAILPSLLAADLGRLADECRRAAEAGADQLHLDIMDGVFVHNISFGPDVVAMARRVAPNLPRNVHLMLAHPDEYVAEFIQAGANTVLIHVEARCDVAATLQCIRRLGARPGLTLNPETPAWLAGPYLSAGLADEVLCMAVHPGFGGQSFIPQALSNIRDVHGLAPYVDISVDGGINEETTAACARAGANFFVAGTTLFRAVDMADAIRRLRATAEASARVGSSVV